MSHPAPPRRVDYLLVGGGLAAVSAASAIRQRDAVTLARSDFHSMRPHRPSA